MEKGETEFGSYWPQPSDTPRVKESSVGAAGKNAGRMPALPAHVELACNSKVNDAY
jgi:hypothetical protein